ncbi:hypothetical protein AK812_SmicGene34497, partial [Symbiodinium microadriaticum]
VLLRNALSKEIPGPSLPFTLMFDYPSIADLSQFLAGSAGAEEEEVEEWIEVAEGVGQARPGAGTTGPAPQRREESEKVRGVGLAEPGQDQTSQQWVLTTTDGRPEMYFVTSPQEMSGNNVPLTADDGVELQPQDQFNLQLVKVAQVRGKAGNSVAGQLRAPPSSVVNQKGVPGPSPEKLREQVKSVVAEIVGMEDLVDDTPLMQAGLTSQSAVLLRNALSKEIPGASVHVDFGKD